MRKCIINVKDKDYTLELDRRSVIWLEENGFNISEMEAKPLKTISLLFAAAMMKNHSDMVADEVLGDYENEDGDITEIIEFLVTEYANFLNALTDTKSSKKKKAKIIQ